MSTKKIFDIPELTRDEAGKLFGGFVSLDPSGGVDSSGINILCTNTNCSCPSNPISTCGETNSQSCTSNPSSCTTNNGCPTNFIGCSTNVVEGCD